MPECEFLRWLEAPTTMGYFCIKIAVFVLTFSFLKFKQNEFIIIIIITRPWANTTKYNYQRDNLLMGHVVRSIVLL